MRHFSFHNLTGSRYESQLRHVLQLIEEAAATDWSASESGAFEKAVSVDALCQAKGVYMSSTSLKNHFKEALGVTIGAYAKERRAAYMGRLFATRPDMQAKDIVEHIGLANAPALYPFVKSLGVDKAQTLRNTTESFKYIEPSSIVSHNAFNVLARTHYGDYSTFNNPQFEEEWDLLEDIATNSGYMVKSYIGIAIDDYIRKNPEAGMFTAGVEIESVADVAPSLMDKRFIIISVPASDYLVFTHIGTYESLVEFYENAVSTVRQSSHYVFNPKGVMFEKYLNTQKDSLASSLITELWIPFLQRSKE